MDHPFNLALHEMMLARGASYIRIEAHWEDVGDPENGPRLDGWPATDLYTDDTHDYHSDENGRVTVEPRDFELERHINEDFDAVTI